jgi:hypothetical protein
MSPRLASLCAALSFLALASAGCVTQSHDGVFGPASDLGAGGESRPFLSLKAVPARGAAPLPVDLTLSARDRDGDALTWTLDFGDGSPLSSGSQLPATVRHTYAHAGAYVATLKVKDKAGELPTTISIVALEGGRATAPAEEPPVQGPEPAPPGYSPPTETRPRSSSSSGTTSSPSPTNSTSSSGTPSDTGSATETPTPTDTGTQSDTGTPTPTDTGSSTDTGTPTDTGTQSDTGTPTPTDTGSSTDTGTPPPSDTTQSDTGTTTDPPM